MTGAPHAHQVVRVLRRRTGDVPAVYWTRAVCACGYATPWMFGEHNARMMVAEPHAVIGRP